MASEEIVAAGRSPRARVEVARKPVASEKKMCASYRRCHGSQTLWNFERRIELDDPKYEINDTMTEAECRESRVSARESHDLKSR